MKKISILVVDDSKSFRELINEFLKQQNEVGEVYTAASGDESIEVVQIHTPNIILMDIVMPGMNGFEASAEIRKNYPEMPIIILSGNEVTDSNEIIKKTGLDGYIQKVNIISDLMPAIFKALRK
jgi:two-component system, NarL family, response regulator DegU